MISIKYVNKQNGITHQSDFQDQEQYSQHQVNYPDMYDGESYDIIDISGDTNKAVTNALAREYLKSTDWYVIRKSETNVEIPGPILTARANARTSIVN